LQSSFQTARAKYAFIDRCPNAFLFAEGHGKTNMMMRRICATLLEAYFDIEKFRDITIAQLIAILKKTKLSKLTQKLLDNS